MKTDIWILIRHRDLWDVPRIFLASYQGSHFLFDCPFDESTEDYPEQYHVYLMPPIKDEELVGSWADLPKKAIRYLGDVAITSVSFDASRCKEIDAAIFQQLGTGTSAVAS